MKGIPETHRKH